jgi:hypothetical protein
MTESRPDPRADLMRRIAETRAIDTRAALEGIRANRTLPIKNRKHSVRHKSYR